MKCPTVLLVVVMSIALATASCVTAHEAPSADDDHPPALGRIKEGQPFPDLTLPTLDGEPLSIAAYRGRKVVLHVFASW